MTRKDFQLIAGIVKDAYYLEENYKNLLAEELADALSTTNPLFNRALFLDACGVK